MIPVEMQIVFVKHLIILGGRKRKEKPKPALSGLQETYNATAESSAARAAGSPIGAKASRVTRRGISLLVFLNDLLL